MADKIESALWSRPRGFRDRADAGRKLAERLRPLAGQEPVVLALPRGGVPVAYEIAEALGAPLDVFVVRKVGHPENREFGLGAVAEGPLVVLDRDSVGAAGVTPEQLEYAVDRAKSEVEARQHRLRGDRPAHEVAGKTVIVVDDGLATGGTARASARALRSRHPRRLILAVGVGPPETVAALEEEFDEVVCLETPAMMWAIGSWYEDFGQVDDDAVVRLLERAASRSEPDPPTAVPVGIALPGGGRLPGDLVFPAQGQGLVLFAHGSGSSRLSPRNRSVATRLGAAGVGTLLFDLLTPEEELDRANVFDIELLAGRLVLATQTLLRSPELRGVPLGYFGASTGAAAALEAAAEMPDQVAAVVSRGGRPDLAERALDRVRAPVLLIVGGADEVVLDLNRQAYSRLRCEKRLSVVPGATHLFEEPGALEEVAALAVEWFTRHLVASARAPA